MKPLLSSAFCSPVSRTSDALNLVRLRAIPSGAPAHLAPGGRGRHSASVEGCMRIARGPTAVSYTHLTLPTILLV
eukprot:2683814-Pyramimonas_sp.AAC.1